VPKTDPTPEPDLVVEIAEAPSPVFKKGGPKRTVTLTCPSCGKVQPSKQSAEQKLEWACVQCGAAFYTMLRIDAGGFVLAQKDW
jgi:hypothetical protein